MNSLCNFPLIFHQLIDNRRKAVNVLPDPLENTTRVTAIHNGWNSKFCGRVNQEFILEPIRTGDTFVHQSIRFGRMFEICNLRHIFFTNLSGLEANWYMYVSFSSYAQPRPFLPHRCTVSVSGFSVSSNNGDCIDRGGMRISCSAFVGQEPMHERQPTH